MKTLAIAIFVAGFATVTSADFAQSLGEDNVFNELYTGPRNDFTGRVGYSFQANQTFQIYALGRAVNPSYNDGVLQNEHIIELWDISTEALVASVTVGPISPMDQMGYVFGLLSDPFTLDSSQEYMLLSDEASGDGDPWSDGAYMTNYDISLMSITGAEYGSSSDGVMPPVRYNWGDDAAYVPPTFAVLSHVLALGHEPANGASTTSAVDTLSWTNTPGTLACDVWFGTDPNNLTRIVDHELVETATISVQAFETYYWQVDCYDSADVLYEGLQVSFVTDNSTPVVNAGADREVWLNEGAVVITLAGELYDDGVPEPATVLWTILTEPNEVTNPAVFNPYPPDVLAPEVTMTATGEYVLQLEADDMLETDSDMMTVTVYADACEHASHQAGFEWKPSDINRDCKTDLADFAALAGDWLKCVSSSCPDE